MLKRIKEKLTLKSTNRKRIQTDHNQLTPQVLSTCCNFAPGFIQPKMELTSANTSCDSEDIDPLYDIMDYLVRFANISFKNGRANETAVHSRDKVRRAYKLYQESPVNFLMQFGKNLAPQHINYFENLVFPESDEGRKLKQCVRELKRYHSEEIRRKRIRNRRFCAMEKFKLETDYFSDKEMMFREPLLYEQLVGQFLSDEEVAERDGPDREGLTLVNLILETVDRNNMRQKKDLQTTAESAHSPKPDSNKTVRWGEFDVPDTETVTKPEKRKQVHISATERRLLHEEFEQEMYSSFMDGRDLEVDYNSIDNNEQYDDLDQLARDAEDKYFDSDPLDVDNLEQHMRLVQVYGGEKIKTNETIDPLDEFMEHLNKKQSTYISISFIDHIT